VAKGAQQAGIFVCSHVLFCRVDEGECMDEGSTVWERMQKSVAFVCCCAGVVVYALDKGVHGGVDGGDDDVVVDEGDDKSRKGDDETAVP